MLLRVSQLHSLSLIDKVVIHSIDQSLYQLSVSIDGVEYYVADNKGKLLRAFNIVDLQKQCRGLNYAEMVLRHQSAYDEMIGHDDTQPGANTLEVPLKDNQLA